MPKVSKAKPETNIINAANLYLVGSEPLLSKKVSAAKELEAGTLDEVGFFLDENI